MGIESYLVQCSLGDWFVLYQLSKNLNRPFFFDFLVHLSQRYDKEYHDEEDDTHPLMSQMESRLKPCKTKILDEVDKKAPLCPEEDCCGFSSKDFDDGDNLIEMLTQPKIRDETDGKKKDDKDDDDDDDDDDDKDEKDDKDDKKEKKKGKDDEGKEGGRRRIGFGDDDDDVRVDIPDGSSYSPTSSKRQTSSNGGKATQSTSRPKGSSKGGRR